MQELKIIYKCMKMKNYKCSLIELWNCVIYFPAFSVAESIFTEENENIKSL